MSNFTVNAVKDSDSTQGLVSYFYNCRSFVAYEDGEIVLNGLSGTNEDCVIYVNKDNYEKVFIMNDNGRTVFTKFAS